MGEFKFKIEQNEDDFIVELGISKNGKKVEKTAKLNLNDIVISHFIVW